MTDPERIEADVRDALRQVEGPDGPVDLVGAERINDLEAGDGGVVRFGVALRPGEPARLAEAAREAAAAVAGVEDVRVALDSRTDGSTWSTPDPPRRESGPEGEDPPPGESFTPDAGTARERASGRSLPVAGGQDPEEGVDPDRRAAARGPGEGPPLDGVDRVLAVSSGKGGVGKSTVATNLAAAWAADGHDVGLLDGDVYGPDIPTMFGLDERPDLDGEDLVPPEAHGVSLMSLGFIVEREKPAIVRGPMLQKVVRQFLQQVRWGELDVLVVDLPPGTGDAQLSLSQLVRLDGGVFVTTPEDVAVDGVLKGVKMFERIEVPVLGLVENMAGFVCPDCGSRHDIFGTGGGERLASELDLPFLGRIPLGTTVREEGERGLPTVLGRPESPEAEKLRSVAGRVRRALEA